MSTVDKRVVEMQFDNKEFEKNVGASMSTIDKLKEKLNFKNVGEGFGNITASAKAVSLDGIASAVDSLNGKFSALGIVGITALQNITNTAINAGKNFINSFTFAPITSGFQEYETQMNAIQTILANTSSKGSTLDDVKEALNDLNTYADKTIYNFTEMTRNIGTFTSAGVGLKDSQIAIKGLANLAAVSGANSQKASSAMYQLSQALASGTVKLQDWNSVVQADMGGEIFQNSLKRTAKAMGTDVDEIIAKEGSFRDSIKDDWLTKDVLIQTLKEISGYYNDMSEAQAKAELSSKGYTDQQITDILTLGSTAYDAATKVKTFSQLVDTLKEAIGSGWTQTWQILIGDFEEAKTFFTSMSDRLGVFVQNSANARNSLLQYWSYLGGRKDLIGIANNIIDAVQSIIEPIKNGFSEVFSFTGKSLKSITQAVEDFTHSLILNGDEQESLKDATKGFASVLKFIFNILKGGIKILESLFKAVSPLGSVILKLTGNVGDAISSFNDWIEKSGILQGAIQFVQDGIVFLSDKIKSLFQLLENNKYVKPIIDKLTSSIANLKEEAKDFKFPTFADFVEDVKNAFSKITKLIDTVKNYGPVKKVLDTVSDAFDKFQNSIKNINTTDIKNGAFETLDKFVTTAGSLKDKVKAVGKSLGDAIKNVPTIANNAWEGMQPFFDGIKNFFKGFFADFDFTAAILLARTLVGLKLVLSISSAISGLGKVFKSTSKVLNAFAKRIKADTFKSRAEGIKDIALSVTMIAGSIAALGVLPLKDLKQGAIAVGIVLAVLVTLSLILDKINSSSDNVGSFKDKVVDALSGFSKSAQIVGFSISALVFVRALSNMVDVLKKFDDLELKDTGETLRKVGAAALILMGAISLLGLSTKKSLGGMIGASLVMFTFITILKNMIGVLELYDDLTTVDNFDESLKKITRVMVILAGTIGLMGLAVKKSFGGLLGSAVVMMVYLYILQKMIDILKDYAAIDYDTLDKGMSYIISLILVLAGSISIMGVATKGALGGLLASCVTIAVLVWAIEKLETVVDHFAKMDLEGLAKGVISIGFLIGVLAAAVAVMGVFGKGSVLISLAAALMAVAGSLFVLSLIPEDKLKSGVTALVWVMGSLGVVLGLSKLAAGSAWSLIAVTAMVAIAAHSLFELSAIPFNKIMKSVAALVMVMGAISVVLGLSKLAAGSAWSLLAVAGVIVAISASLYFLSGCSADGIKVATIAIMAISVMIDILLGVAKGAEDAAMTLGMMAMLVAGIGIMLYLLSGLPVESVLGSAASISLILLSLSEAMSIMGVLPVSAALKVVADLAIFIAGITGILAALGALNMIDGVQEFLNGGSQILNIIGSAIGSFVGSIISGFATGVSSGFPQIATDLSDFMTNLQPFIEGASNLDEGVLNGIKSLAESILLITASELIDALTSFITKGQSLSDFGKSLSAFAPDFMAFANQVKGVDVPSVTATCDAVNALANMAKNLPNSGGVVGFFAGENDLDTFGTMLSSFGLSMTAYSNSIKYIDSDVVANSQTAVDAMSALLTVTLPNSGGVIGFFAGENDLDTFGTMLSSFGLSMTAYSNSIHFIDSNVVTNSKLASDALVSLTSVKIPNTGGVIGFLVGNNDIDTFGTKLVSFGTSMVAFSTTIKNLDLSKVGLLVDDINDLVAMFGNMNNVGEDSTDNFIASLNSIGTISISAVADSFTDNSSSVSDALIAVLVTAETNAYGEESNFTEVAKSLMMSFVIGMAYQTTSAIMEVSNIIEIIRNAFKDGDILLYGSGLSSGQNYSNGLSSKSSDAKRSAESLIKSATSGILFTYSEFYHVGEDAGKGFVDGMGSYIGASTSAGANLGTAALNAAKKAIDSNSPSKEFGKLGMYSDLGFANMITKYSSVSEDAAYDMASNSLSAAENAVVGMGEIIDDVDTQPTIRPVLDLSDVDAGMSKLNSYFGSTRGISIGGFLGNATPSNNSERSIVYNIYVDGFKYNDTDMVDGRVKDFADSFVEGFARRRNMYAGN